MARKCRYCLQCFIFSILYKVWFSHISMTDLNISEFESTNVVSLTFTPWVVVTLTLVSQATWKGANPNPDSSLARSSAIPSRITWIITGYLTLVWTLLIVEIKVCELKQLSAFCRLKFRSITKCCGCLLSVQCSCYHRSISKETFKACERKCELKCSLFV